MRNLCILSNPQKTDPSDFCSCLFPSGQDLVLLLSRPRGSKNVYTLTPSMELAS